MACVTNVVVTSPVLFPSALRISRTVANGAPLPGKATLITPFPTFAPVAMAVAEAAESVTPPSALSVLTDPRCGKDSNDRVPLFPALTIPAALTCSNPIPSPMNRMMCFASPVGREREARNPHGLPQDDDKTRRRERETARKNLAICNGATDAGSEGEGKNKNPSAKEVLMRIPVRGWEYPHGKPQEVDRVLAALLLPALQDPADGNFPLVDVIDPIDDDLLHMANMLQERTRGFNVFPFRPARGFHSRPG